MNSSNRSEIAAASDQLDKALAEGADSLGESRTGVRRIAFSDPLLIYFEVDVLSSTAYVIAVRDCRRSS